MTIRSGLAAQMGIASEVTWGTRVAPTRFHPIVRESMTGDKGRSESESIYAARRVLHYLVEHFPALVYNQPPDPSRVPDLPDGA